MLNIKIRQGWDRFMRPVGRALAAAHVSADAVTLFGVAVQIVASVMILDGRLMAAGLVSVVAAFADAFDGAVAKARGTSSKFGALLDSTTDRLSDALFCVPIAWLYGVSPDVAGRADSRVAALALAALVSSFLVSYVKARAEGLGLDCNVGIAERAERIIIIIAGLIFDQLLVALGVLTLLATITFLQRIVHVRRQVAAS